MSPGIASLMEVCQGILVVTATAFLFLLMVGAIIGALAFIARGMRALARGHF